MTNLPKSASPSEPRPNHAKEKCQSCICYEHLLHLIQLAVCDPHEAVKGNLPSKAKAVEMIIDRAEPQRDEPELQHFIDRWTNPEDLLGKAGMTVLIKLLLKERAARSSAAPLKQTGEIRNQVLEEAALETLSFLEEVPAEKWPPFGLCPELNRAGDSVETARNIAEAIRKLKSTASLPQPSAGHADVEVFADHAEECMQPIGLTTCGYPRAHIIHNNKASMSYHNFMPPSAGQTEGK